MGQVNKGSWPKNPMIAVCDAQEPSTPQIARNILFELPQPLFFNVGGDHFVRLEAVGLHKEKSPRLLDIRFSTFSNIFRFTPVFSSTYHFNRLKSGNFSSI
jgi:hypothetical protein